MLDLPMVLHKDKKEPFDQKKITESLMKETGLSKIRAEYIAIEVKRFVISNNLKIVTGPLLREVTNVFLLSHNYELERLKNTRIGIPMYDLDEMEREGKDMNGSISEHVLRERQAVKKLIGECQ